ncbi:MAG: hypothetical protein PVJ92_01040 [Candidatus Dependentiae bacterium]|jgi:hypothetical protein
MLSFFRHTIFLSCVLLATAANCSEVSQTTAAAGIGISNAELKPFYDAIDTLESSAPFTGPDGIRYGSTTPRHILAAAIEMVKNAKTKEEYHFAFCAIAGTLN